MCSYNHLVAILFIFAIIKGKVVSFSFPSNYGMIVTIKLMKFRALTQIVLLLAVMQATSAFKFRCYWFCTEQTGIQTDYVNDRDDCRKYAQLRIDTDTSSPELMSDNSRKQKLVSLFSSCMSDKGWTVPDGKGGQNASAPIPVPTPGASAGMAPAQPAPGPLPVAAPVPMAATQPANPAIITEQEAKNIQAQRKEKTYLARQSECAFARHSADISSVSATRAKACDLECANMLKQDPIGQRPAACAATQ
jgi:hypothetical protein